MDITIKGETLANKTNKETVIESINKAIDVINKIKIKGYGWDIESSVSASKDELIQALGLIIKQR